ncbi:DUF4337 domain-containing protein [Caulobacter sp. Root1472]|uniref:DUF4337 domain-containing protein n=1 Tax=Caulobacter sp. Root1472 TaxID=1736470 RepID=UPI000701B5F6|nr:DUF4337 domain-containing protein [Caulobacter sp. Root1472]KQZ22422.1 hypothetical protein ASD47_25010 [Caulobacter sp. Root1472]
MDIEIGAEAKDKSFNRRVAITVVALSIFMGLCGVKDGNIVQAMQQAQSDGVDAWNEYQATKTKLHIDETAVDQARLLAVSGGETTRAAVNLETVRLQAEMGKYRSEIPALKAKAEGYAGQYDALNVHDDQFDASDALISIAVSIAAVAALVEIPAALWASWAFGALGVVMGLAGFLGWSLHSALLGKLLG